MREAGVTRTSSVRIERSSAYVAPRPGDEQQREQEIIRVLKPLKVALLTLLRLEMEWILTPLYWENSVETVMAAGRFAHWSLEVGCRPSSKP